MVLDGRDRRTTRTWVMETAVGLWGAEWGVSGVSGSLGSLGHSSRPRRLRRHATVAARFRPRVADSAGLSVFVAKKNNYMYIFRQWHSAPALFFSLSVDRRQRHGFSVIVKDRVFPSSNVPSARRCEYIYIYILEKCRSGAGAGDPRWGPAVRSGGHVDSPCIYAYTYSVCVCLRARVCVRMCRKIFIYIYICMSKTVEDYRSLFVEVGRSLLKVLHHFLDFQ